MRMTGLFAFVGMLALAALAEAQTPIVTVSPDGTVNVRYTDSTSSSVVAVPRQYSPRGTTTIRNSSQPNEFDALRTRVETLENNYGKMANALGAVANNVRTLNTKVDAIWTSYDKRKKTLLWAENVRRKSLGLEALPDGYFDIAVSPQPRRAHTVAVPTRRCRGGG